MMNISIGNEIIIDIIKLINVMTKFSFLLLLYVLSITQCCIIFLGTKQDESTNFVCSRSGLGLKPF